MSKEKANERINSRITSASTGKSHINPLFILLVGIICVLVLVIVALFFRKDAEEQDIYNTVITPDNVEYVISQLKPEEYTPVGSYEVAMNFDWVFPDGGSASANAYVENPVNNRNMVFFTISLADDMETDIYRSPYLEIGSHIENIKLDSELGAGKYDAVLTYHLVDDARQEMSSVSVAITITIEN